MSNKKKLTAKQKRFVAEYLLDLNATAAALRAGYKHGDIGRQLLTKTHVCAAVAEALKSRAERVMVSIDDVVRMLLKAATREDKGGSPSSRVRAIELLGQHLGMFSKKVELTGAKGSPLVPSLSELSDAELDRLIADAETEDAGIGEGASGTGASPD